MLVVADSSPLNVLIRAGHIEILQKLFARVAIPTEIARELTHPRTPPAVKEFLASAPSWLVIQEPSEIERIAKLDAGERAAICLARELKADFLLIDERDGRRAAIQRKLLVIGTIGVLELAARENLLSLTLALQKLPADFVVRLAPQMVKDALARDAARKRQRS